MLLIKSFHLIAMVAWFAGLFYLPRLFVYHAEAKDTVSIERFIRMEYRLYYGITWPAALLTLAFGLTLLLNNMYYLKSAWMHAKMGLVALLISYHLMCGHFRKRFSQGKNLRTSTFFRMFNEIPTVLLIGIILLAVIRP